MEILIKEIETSLNIAEIYAHFNSRNNIMLDSSKEDKELSKFSFIGVNPFLIFKWFGEFGEIIKDEEIEKFESNPLEKLRELTEAYKIEIDNKIPLVSGTIGYISYDYGKRIEGIEGVSKKNIEIPEIYFVFYDNIIVKDLSKNKTFVTSRGILKDRKISLKEIEDKIHKITKTKDEKFNFNTNKFTSNFYKEDYLKAISKMKDYIVDGHIYIANMTQNFCCENSEDSFYTYRKLREINPAPFSAYMHLDGFEVISSSPERFLKLNNRGKVETKPIKGTRKRGKTLEEDEKNRRELENSEKDKAELLMIVDLERNDLSKVCKPHSVKVEELFKIEEYSTVFHLVSKIVGELREKEDIFSLLKATFPGGSITGAPKLRAMEIIHELEKLERGLYTGSIGYIDFRGNSDFNIVIRTIIKQKDKAYFGVGGGITYDSLEESEYEETLDKGKALMRVL